MGCILTVTLLHSSKRPSSGHMLEECVRRQRSSDSLDHRYNPWSFVSGAERIGGILTPPAGFWSIL